MRRRTTGRVFADTSVLACAYDPRSADRRARALLLLERLGGARRGVISTQVLGELCDVLTRRLEPALSPADARRALAAYVPAWSVVPVTPRLVLEAADAAAGHSMHFWDALICAAARSAGCRYVLSEDFQHGRTIDGVQFVDPFRDDFDLEALLA